MTGRTEIRTWSSRETGDEEDMVSFEYSTAASTITVTPLSGKKNGIHGIPRKSNRRKFE